MANFTILGIFVLIIENDKKTGQISFMVIDGMIKILIKTYI